MPEWRKDPVVDRWVVISTERSKRPSNFKVTEERIKGQVCSLCPGREHETPPEVLSFREQGTRRDNPGWWVRVVPNKFPAVSAEAAPEVYNKGIYAAMDGLGAHEVVIESPDHVDNLDVEDDRQIEEILWAWRDRLLSLRQDKRMKYIQIFKNFGETAGASLEHTHSQIVAIPMVPHDITLEMEGAKKYTENTGRCIFCDMIASEIQQRERMIMQRERFVTLAPFASRFPFETWVMPVKHQHDFAGITKEEAVELSSMLRCLLVKMALLLHKPPYNMVLHNSTVNLPDTSYYHWRLEVLPRLTVIAGFELGTGLYINPTPPELAAKCLSEC